MLQEEEMNQGGFLKSPKPRRGDRGDLEKKKLQHTVQLSPG